MYYLLSCCAETELFTVFFQCFLFTNISGPSFGPMQIRDRHAGQQPLIRGRVFERRLSGSRFSCCFVKAAGQAEDPGNFLLSDEAPRGHMPHALPVPADASHQQPAGMCLQEGSQTDAPRRLFLPLQHGFAWKGALGYTRLKGEEGQGEAATAHQSPSKLL